VCPYAESEAVLAVLRVHGWLHGVVSMADAWASALTLPKMTAAFQSQTLGQGEMSVLSAEAMLSTTCLAEGQTIPGWIPQGGGGETRGGEGEGGERGGIGRELGGIGRSGTGGEGGKAASLVAAVVVTGGVRTASDAGSATGGPGRALWPKAANEILGAEPAAGLASAAHVAATASPTLLLVPSLFALSESAQKSRAELAAKIEVWGGSNPGANFNLIFHLLGYREIILRNVTPET